MLGKLFSTAASSLTPRGGSAGSSRPATALDSVHEDIHTRNLLFPDSEALYQHQHDQVFPLASSAVPLPASSTNTFDLNPDIDLDLRDVRVVVLQETTATQSAALLFDSHPLLEASPPPDRQSPPANGAGNSRSGSGRTITSPRRISLDHVSKPVITQENSIPRNFGAFDRRPSNHSRGASYAETEGQRSAREYREEMTTFSNCIFGSSDVMAFKGTGTKVHIIPTETRSSYPFGDGHGSLGRSSMRNSKLAQSFTSENIASGLASAGLPGTGSGLKTLEKKKVLITRIFPVPLPNTDVEEDSRVSASQKEEASGYPFPTVGNSTKQPDKKPRQKRTPMYAIGLIIQLPATTHLPSELGPRPGFRGPSSYTEQESYPSSFNSSKPSVWTVLGNGVESLESSFSDFDDRMDAITQHWDIIKRTLTHLQAVVSSSVLDLLKQVDVASSDLQKPNPLFATSRTPTASVSISGRRVEETAKPYKSNAKLVQLMANSLFRHQNIKTEVDEARQRIISGIKTLQVVTRQGRWGIWREEARWVGKWAGGKEEGFFFYNLMTGFLGNHTEWLQALGPENYRRHYYQQHKSMRDEDTHIAARTIIVSHDKMAARRLLFLLSSFLPPNQQYSPFARFYRPSTATSFGGYSQSPPSFFPTLVREGSLRRKVNRRTGPARHAHARTLSFPSQIANQSSLPGVSHIVEESHERRHSDVAFLKTTNLPIPGSEGGSKKSSAATTTTVTPAATIPHFSTRRPIRGTGPLPRPGSSGSLAADDLFRTLKRGDSTEHYSNASTDSHGYSRWGSMISGFWSNKRQDSANSVDIIPPPLGGLEIDPKCVDQKKDKLAEMAKEASKQVQGAGETQDNVKGAPTTITYTIPEPPTKVLHANREPRVAHPAGAYESPVKTSINEDDGVIDIDVPLPDYITSSFGSAFSSPSSSGYLSNHGFGPGLEGFEQYARIGPDADAPLNVGGWLPRYHPDFTLQAVPAQGRLEGEVKASMRAEPTPHISPPHLDEKTRWVDISSALIADATKFTIKRIRYRRHILLTAPHSQQQAEHKSPTQRSQSLYGNPYVYQQGGGAHFVIEDAFDEDAVISMDETLISAVEATIVQPSTLPSSSAPILNLNSGTRPSSPHSTSRHQARDREGSDSTAIPIPRSNPPASHSGSSPSSPVEVRHRPHLQVPEVHLEVPRGECKKVILGALEDIARQVAEFAQDDSISPDQARTLLERESALREGVREWMRAVEDWA